MSSNMALNLTPFGHWALSLKVSHHRSRHADHLASLIFRSVTIITAALFCCTANAQSLQEKLFQRVTSAADSKQTINNGVVCEYTIGKTLSLSIKDVGGNDTVIGFAYSNINEELYAVLYFGCVVVVPGRAHPPGYDRNYGVHISTKNGLVYKTHDECLSAK